MRVARWAFNPKGNTMVHKGRALVVHPHHQRKGIGSTLLESAVADTDLEVAPGDHAVLAGRLQLDRGLVVAGIDHGLRLAALGYVSPVRFAQMKGVA
jgi:GNAT superfamily N-acetyltransferase